MVRNKLLALEPWRPFFWDRWLATGVYLRAMRRPALLPSGHEVDEEIYFAASLIPKVEIKALRFVGYAFRLDPGTHTSRSVRREGYRGWGRVLYFDICYSIHRHAIFSARGGL